MEPALSRYTDSKQRLWVLLHRWGSFNCTKTSRKKTITYENQLPGEYELGEYSGMEQTKEWDIRVDVDTPTPTTVDLLDVHGEKIISISAEEFERFIQEGKLVRVFNQ